MRLCYASNNVVTTIEEKQAFVLSDDEILQLARWAKAIEDHYQRFMDMEWAKDGQSGERFMVPGPSGDSAVQTGSSQPPAFMQPLSAGSWASRQLWAQEPEPRFYILEMR